MFKSGGPIPGYFRFSYIDYPFPNDSGVGSQLPSGFPDVASVLIKQPGMLLTHSGAPIPDNMLFTHTDTLLPDISGVRYNFASANLDLVGDLGRNTLETQSRCESSNWKPNGSIV